jgi:hypothetical protein
MKWVGWLVFWVGAAIAGMFAGLWGFFFWALIFGSVVLLMNID